MVKLTCCCQYCAWVVTDKASATKKIKIALPKYAEFWPKIIEKTGVLVYKLITAILLINYMRGRHLYAFAQKDYPKGMQHDFKVQFQGNIFYVYEVVLHAFNHLSHVFCITKLYHAPGG